MEYVHRPAWAGCLAVLPPFLHTRSLAEHGRLEKVLDFLATTKTISVINTLLVLNPKYCSYWEENEVYPSPDQDNDISSQMTYSRIGFFLCFPPIYRDIYKPG